MRGTKNLNRQQIQDLLDKNVARLGTGMNMRMLRGAGSQGLGTITFTIETKRQHLAAVLEILRQILREPSLPGSEFEVMKNEEIASVQQGVSDPMRQGLTHIQRLVSKYPTDDVRYVPTIDEQLERLKNVSLDQVRRLYDEYLGAEHGEVVVVGDFDASEISPILSKTFDGWKSQKPYAWIERAYQPGIEPRRESVSTPDKENAIYLSALTMPIKDDDPDYPALLLGNFVLGGGSLSSRIADRLRQQGGLSTAMSILQASPVDRRASFMVLAIYNPANVAKVTAGVDEELARLLKVGVKTAELEKAKSGYLQQQQNARTSDAMLTASLAENLYLGRTMQFQADLEQKIKELTPEVVDTALRKHLDPKRLSVVTAGDFSKK